MHKPTNDTHLAATDAVTKGKLKAHAIGDDMSWGVGGIQPNPDYSSREAQQHLIDVVMDSLAVVNKAELPYSACTDGRVPVHLDNGEAVPVREQLVGADTMTVFHMAEVLGSAFYGDPDTPLGDRLAQVTAFLRGNGLKPCTHFGCGAAAAFVVISQNLLDFVKDERFISRQKSLLPEGVYSEDLRQQINRGYQERLSKGVYDGWSDALVTDAVRHASTPRGITKLNDDGRGVHGHVEEQIIRIKASDIATDEMQVVARTAGREVFSVSDARMQRLAKLISRGDENLYWMALMAAEDFTDGGHGTLAKNLPTYVVTVV